MHTLCDLVFYAEKRMKSLGLVEFLECAVGSQKADMGIQFATVAQLTLIFLVLAYLDQLMISLLLVVTHKTLTFPKMSLGN